MFPIIHFTTTNTMNIFSVCTLNYISLLSLMVKKKMNQENIWFNMPNFWAAFFNKYLNKFKTFSWSNLEMVAILAFSIKYIRHSELKFFNCLKIIIENSKKSIYLVWANFYVSILELTITFLILMSLKEKNLDIVDFSATQSMGTIG